ncbi:NUDIX hydrolase [Allokutzneria sp. A3M-2-11 16]|uniref:NUDIX domain-containing protein n=1 Tax=Allokutzneria sp. A3M-2-11 16 TaxID=2962043 RepID=UPI0020B79F59|nr:NUDIX hydrolase [Allokutzneria sp. A3M-2-11 16]MCP3797881.1 NUDIX hydrolase [Allokutzneria sp. A3M-2-11 16]
MIITADLVVVASRAGQWQVLLIRRGKPPFAGRWALPGGHVDPGESTVDAAVRELAEETGLRCRAGELRWVGNFTAPGRDPRGDYASTAYLLILPEAAEVTGASDATEARWWPVTELPGLAFDHEDIIARAISP